MHFGLECYEIERESSNALRKEEIRILKITLKILIRAIKTLFYKTAKIQNSADRMELLKYKFRLSNDYTRQFIEEIKKIAVRHENSIIEEHLNTNEYQQTISQGINYLQNKCKFEFSDTIQSEKLRKLITNFMQIKMKYSR